MAKKDLGVKGADPIEEEAGEIQGYKDSPSIDKSHTEQLEEFRGFKAAGKDPETQWLKKKNKVREEIDPFYSPYEPGVKR